jgi:hypothetical protein
MRLKPYPEITIGVGVGVSGEPAERVVVRGSQALKVVRTNERFAV